MCAALVVSSTTRTSAQPVVRVGTPVPGWVDRVDAPTPNDDFEGGVEDLLLDRQLSLEPETAARFVRVAYRVRNPSGVQAASQLSVDVGADGSLDWHYARVVRDGVTHDRLRERSQLRVIQPEHLLGAGLYSERRRALLFLEDVRPGDLIEYAVTTRRPLSVFGGRYVADEDLQRLPTRRYRVSVRWPPEHAVQTRLHNVDPSWIRREVPGHLIVEIPRSAEAPVRALDAPLWYSDEPSLQLSDFAGWDEVARWGAQAYERTARGPFPSSVPMDAIEAGATLRERVRRALRFVQEDVRYLGLETGEHAMLPYSPAEVARRRYGDCKDKSLLLVTILRRLGVTADVALVHAQARQTVESHVPSPFAFNHAVVRVEMEGETYWFDATRSAERGPLASLPPVLVGRALIVSDETEGLTELPVPIPEEPLLEVTEHVDLRGERPTLDLETVYRGSLAVAMRRRVQATTTAEVQSACTAFLETIGYSDLSVAERIEIADDEASNEIVVREHYRLRQYWREGRASVSPWAVLRRIGEPASERPSDAPVGVEFPLHVAHRVVVDNRNGWSISPGSQSWDAGPLNIARRVEVSGNRLDIAVQARTRADHVAPEDVGAYRVALEGALSEITYELLEVGGRDGSYLPLSSLACLGIIGLLFFGGVMRKRIRRVWRGRRRRAFERKQRVKKGESPETAIDVGELDEAKAAHRPPPCCGAQTGDAAWSTVRFGGRRVAIVANVCDACGERRRRYYRLPTGD